MPDQSPDFDFCFKHIYMGLVIFFENFLKLLRLERTTKCWSLTTCFTRWSLGRNGCSPVLRQSPTPPHLVTDKHQTLPFLKLPRGKVKRAFNRCNLYFFTAVCIFSRQMCLLFTVWLTTCVAVNGLLMSFCFAGCILLPF